MNANLRGRARHLYERVAPVLVVLIGLTAAAGIWIGAAATITNGQQDVRADTENRARDAATTKLLACFDRYAAASSTSSKAVRIASVRKDRATDDRDDALNIEGQAFLQLTKRLLTGEVTPGDVKRLADSLTLRARASRTLDRAQDALDQARRDNPIPDPPSEFCGSDADTKEPTR